MRKTGLLPGDRRPRLKNTPVQGCVRIGHFDFEGAVKMLAEHAYFLYAAAMPGHLDLVRGYLKHHPNLFNAKGLHGLSLIHDARKGGVGPAGVLVYLESFKTK